MCLIQDSAISLQPVWGRVTTWTRRGDWHCR